MLDMGDAARAYRLTVTDRLAAEPDNSQDNDTLCQTYRLARGARLTVEYRTVAWQDALTPFRGDGMPHALARTEQRGTGDHP